MSDDTKQNEKDDLGIEGLDDAFGSDSDLETKGAWMIVPGVPGRRIRLRSQSSAIVRNVGQKIQKRHRALYASNKLPSAEEQDADDVELLARGIVTGWEMFGALPCTEVNVRTVMSRYPAFRDMCLKWSKELENYQQQTTEAMAGNPAPTLTPNSD